MTSKFPRNLRIIPRIVIVILIVSLVVYVGFSSKANNFVLFLTKNVENNPGNTNLRIQLAKAKLMAGDLKGANKEIETALEFSPKNPYALAFLGKIAKNSEDTDREIKRVEEVVSKRPDYQAAWMRLSVLYERAGRVDLSKQAKEKADKLKTT